MDQVPKTDLINVSSQADKDYGSNPKGKLKGVSKKTQDLGISVNKRKNHPSAKQHKAQALAGDGAAFTCQKKNSNGWYFVLTLVHVSIICYCFILYCVSPIQIVLFS